MKENPYAIETNKSQCLTSPVQQDNSGHSWVTMTGGSDSPDSLNFVDGSFDQNDGTALVWHLWWRVNVQGETYEPSNRKHL